uniref:NFP second LysM domain-containing protein n=1 Tax=Oryza glumipatula TaxID=40148 RepID=A0A0E0BM37_9ORYZ
MASRETDGCVGQGGDETHEAATGEGRHAVGGGRGCARVAGQPLLVPLQCGCPSHSPNAYAPMQYQINAGDTFWIVSTTKLQNLMQYQAVERVNPTLVPTNLDIGQIDMFPSVPRCVFPSVLSPQPGRLRLLPLPDDDEERDHDGGGTGATDGSACVSAIMAPSPCSAVAAASAR